MPFGHSRTFAMWPFEIEFKARQDSFTASSFRKHRMSCLILVRFGMNYKAAGVIPATESSTRP
jgi:hypothetical protein